MPARSALLVALGAGFAALGVLLLARRSVGPEPGEGPAPSPESRVKETVEELSQRVERLKGEKVDRSDLVERVDALERRFEALEERLGGLAVRLAEVQRDVEGPDLAELSDEELASQARAAQGRRDHAAAVKCWKALLDRGIEGEARSDALFQLGFAHRGLGDHASEEQVFRDIVHEEGPDTERGTWARFQLAWSRFYQSDVRGARDWMEKLIDARNASDTTRNWARMWTADFSIRLSEPDVARPILEGIVRDLADTETPNERQLLDLAKRRLAEIDG